MPRSIRALASCAALVAVGMAVPAQSSAFVVGIGDQKASTFSDPLFTALKVKRTRLIVPFNAALKPNETAETDAWIGAAKMRGLEIVIAFNPDSQFSSCPNQPCRAPSIREYRRAIKAFHARWGRFVKIYQPWNESNSRTQPTSGNRGARLVARYYKELRRIAGRRRTVTGADIQDIGDFIGYTRTFLRAVGRRNAPKVMGLHNYTDTNRFKFKSTARFVRAMPRGTKVWLTETGAIYSLTLFDGRVSLAPSETRARRSMTHMFKIAKRYRRVIDRVYVYQWQKTRPTDRFDAGVVNEDGSPRSSYSVLRKNRKLIR